MGLRTKAVVGFVSMFGASAASAQDLSSLSYGVETGLSTLGAYVAPEVQIYEGLNVRAPIYFGGTSGTFDIGGNSSDLEADVGSVTILGDYYIANSGLRLSAGVSFGGYELNGTVINPEIDGTTYNGNFGFNVAERQNVVPVLALGYRFGLTEAFSLNAELGARISTFSVTTTGQDALPPADRAQFDADIDSLNNDLDDFGAIPYVSLGVSFSF